MENLGKGIIQPRQLKNNQLTVAISTKALGNMSLDRDFDGSAQENFARFLKLLQINPRKSSIVIFKLAQSSNVALIKKRRRNGRIIVDQLSPEVVKLEKFSNGVENEIKSPNLESGIDACISKSANLFLAILHADCAPVMIFDPATRYFALVHVGSLGVFSEIVKNTVSCMRNWCKSRPEDFICYIGPCISPGYYLLEHSRLWPLIKNLGKNVRTFDIRKQVRQQLLDCGVKKSKITVSSFCTARDQHLFFSNHLAGPNQNIEGRNIALIGLK